MAVLHITHNRREDDMTSKLITPLAAAAILGGLFAATTAFAEETTSQSQRLKLNTRQVSTVG